MVAWIHLSTYVAFVIEKIVNGDHQGLERGGNMKVLVKTYKVSVIQSE